MNILRSVDNRDQGLSASLFKSQFNGIYNNKTVFVTGHTGFKGSWLSYWLSMLGAKVIGFSRDIPTQPSHFELWPFPENGVSYIKDIIDFDALLQTMTEHQPEIVFHLAAQSLVRYSYAHPLETFATNVMGTAHVLECSRQVDSVRAIVNVTSDKCYENKETGAPFRETDPMGGYDPYSCSKGASELLTSCFRNSFFQGSPKLLASGRAGNVIGGGDWAQDNLIPDLVRAVSQGEVAHIRNPHAIRPWQHVLEPLSAYLLLGQKLLEEQTDFAEGWNFGPKDDESLSVLEILKLFKHHWPTLRYAYDQKPNDLHEANFLRLDCSKANQRLNWQPVWPSDLAVQKTVEWYKSYYEEQKINTPSNLIDYAIEAQRLGYVWAGPPAAK